NEKHTVTVTPRLNENNEYKIGFAPDIRLGLASGNEVNFKRLNPLEAVSTAFFRMCFNIKITVVGVLRVITLRSGIADMSGFIGITSMIGETYEETIKISLSSMIMSIATLCALLSANLGVINLFPLPALDGGRLVFLTLEGIRKKPVPPEREGMIHFVGFVLLMILAIFIAYQDILKML
ncbi:MAG: site-2 protease family protein, partial [Defluviitaleaceae bacterium]|nr:site-2 protease family protein [Defluviitaleaceae bacterium]